MGGKKVDNSTTPQQVIQYLKDLFSYALVLGMTYDQYWKDDPFLMIAYVKADEYRQIRKNQEYWLQGLYTYIAVGNLSPIFNPFSKEKKARKYLDQPIPITKQEQDAIENARVQKIYDKFVKLTKKGG